MKKSIIFLLVVLSAFAGHAQIIPAPESIKYNKGHFVLDADTGVVLTQTKHSEISKLANYLTDKIESETGVKISPKKENKKNIQLELLQHPSKNLGDEGYLLTISAAEIHIAANSYAGLFYGTQSLLQYVIANNTQTPIQLPNLSISDKPNVAWRGMVMDVSRHFYNVNAIKELLDLMAF